MNYLIINKIDYPKKVHLSDNLCKILTSTLPHLCLISMQSPYHLHTISIPSPYHLQAYRYGAGTDLIQTGYDRDAMPT